MKLCITSVGASLDSNIDPRFGRCAYFIIYDTDDDTFESIENASRQAMGGAGIQSGQMIASKNVEAVLTGNFGPNAFRVLQAAKIKMYSGVTGTVKDAIEKYKNGQLTEISSPSVQSHYGMGKRGGQ
jgi:predicted Fe-Mo cluster-binding NifX family protein